MAKDKKEGVSYRNTILKLCLLVFIMLGFILMLINTFKSQNRRVAENRFYESVKASGWAVNTEMEKNLYAGRTAVMTLSEMLGSEEYDADVLKGGLERIRDDIHAECIIVTDLDNSLIASAGTIPAEPDEEGEGGLSAINGGIGVLSKDTDDGVSESFVISYPVLRKGAVAGFATAFLPMSVFTEAARSNSIEWSAGNILLSKEGVILSATVQGDLKAGDVLFDNPSFSFNKGMTADGFYDTMSQGKDGSMFFKLGDAEYFVRYEPVAENRWYLLSLIPAEKRASQIASYISIFNQIGMSFTVGFLVFLIMAGFVLYSELKSDTRSRSKLRNDAEKDLLTGVYNKLSTEKYIREYMAEDGRPGLFYIIDIDDFKHINDSFGHAFGDEVLKAVGKRLNTEFRATDIIGRLGGDEFCVFLKNLSNEEEKNKQIERMSTVFKNISAGEHVKYNPTASIGGAEFPKYGSTFEEIYKAADHALYEVKRNGKNGLRVYEREE